MCPFTHDDDLLTMFLKCSFMYIYKCLCLVSQCGYNVCLTWPCFNVTVYFCTYITFTNTHAHTLTHTRTHAHSLTHTHTHIYTHTRTHAHTHTNVRKHIHNTHIYTRTHTRTHTHTSHIIAHLSTRVWVYVRTRTPDPYCIYTLIAQRIQSYMITLSS